MKTKINWDIILVSMVMLFMSSVTFYYIQEEVIFAYLMLIVVIYSLFVFYKGGFENENNRNSTSN